MLQNLPELSLLEEFQLMALNAAKSFLPNLIQAVIIFFAGRYGIRLCMRFIDKLFLRYEWDPTLETFAAKFIHAGLNVILIVLVITTLGVQTSSLVTMLGAASLAVGLALQGSLSNFAGGVLILLLKPFKLGDTITSKGVTGLVIEVSLFYTVIKTANGQRVTIPNGQVSNDVVTNFSSFQSRRIDIDVYVSSAHTISAIKPVLNSLVIEDTRVLQEPAAQVYVESVNEHRIHFKLRAWVEASQYSSCLNDLNERIMGLVQSESLQLSSPA